MHTRKAMIRAVRTFFGHVMPCASPPPGTTMRFGRPQRKTYI